MIDPPLLAGAVKLIVADVAEATAAVTAVGAPGGLMATGITAALAALAGPVPTEVVAVTVKVYEVPLVRPVTLTGEVAPVPVNPPGEDVTVYEVIGAEPELAGAVNVTVAVPLTADADTAVGAPGRIPDIGVTGALAVLAGPVPTALVAVTVNV
jgi:hypothetical protein